VKGIGVVCLEILHRRAL